MAYKILPYFFPGSSHVTSYTTPCLQLLGIILFSHHQGLCIDTFHNSKMLCLLFYLIHPHSIFRYQAKLYFFREAFPGSSSPRHVLLQALTESDSLFKKSLPQFAIMHYQCKYLIKVYLPHKETINSTKARTMPFLLTTQYMPGTQQVFKEIY